MDLVANRLIDSLLRTYDLSVDDGRVGGLPQRGRRVD